MNSFGIWPWSDRDRRPLLIYGAGEFARLASIYFRSDSPYEVEGFLVDDGYEVVSPVPDLPTWTWNERQDSISPTSHDIFVAMSGTRLSEARTQHIERLLGLGYQLPSYVSSRAFISDDVKIGANVFVFEHNTLQSRVSIADGTVLWSGNHVGHETQIGKGVFVSSHVCIGGRSRIGERSYLGMNCTIRDQVSLGAFTVVGSNSYVGRNSTGDEVLVGTPARVLPGADPFEAVK